MIVCIQVKMSQVKQVGLLAAGCQPWNKDVCAASGDRFAYCATLAIYVYQVNTYNGNPNVLIVPKPTPDMSSRQG